jgi:hypothetical protein
MVLGRREVQSLPKLPIKLFRAEVEIGDALPYIAIIPIFASCESPSQNHAPNVEQVM